MERIEEETEIHRTQKALRQILRETDAEGDILFSESRVLILASPHILAQPGGQLALALLVNLLARMKTIISQVAVSVQEGIPLHGSVPLVGGDLRSGLEQLVKSMNGPESRHPVAFNFEGAMHQPTLVLALGWDRSEKISTDIVVQADAWSAYLNTPNDLSNWTTRVPIGPHMAAALAVAEVFKRLLLHNFPNQIERQLRLADNISFCALNYGDPPASYPSLPAQIILDNIAIAGLGAGGSAALYSLACFADLDGEITLIEPGNHKKSNLARYLLSDYHDCQTGTAKVHRAHAFLRQHHPALNIRVERLPYDKVDRRDFRLVISTVDTPEARWDIQRDWPSVILDAAVIETIYTILRVYPGQGVCLGCKHPYDPDVTWKRRAKMWGKTVEEVRQLHVDRTHVTELDLEVLAEVQNQPIENFRELVGIPFDQIPALTECGQARFNLQVPNQVATLPFHTAMAGVLLAAEVVKDQYAPEWVLYNWFKHDMMWTPKPNLHRFRRRLESCPLCQPAGEIVRD